jgi:hypothetical protein
MDMSGPITSEGLEQGSFEVQVAFGDKTLRNRRNTLGFRALESKL